MSKIKRKPNIRESDLPESASVLFCWFLHNQSPPGPSRRGLELSGRGSTEPQPDFLVRSVSLDVSRLVAFVSSFAISLTSGLSMGWNRKNYELDKNAGTALKKGGGRSGVPCRPEYYEKKSC